MKKHNTISWIALVLSIIACIITWVRVDVYFTNDTFVGIMAGFMGACATIVVGAQIYNSIETKRSIKELEEVHNKRIQEMNDKMKETENKLRCAISITQASSVFDYQPIAAFVSLHNGMEYALEIKDKDLVEKIFANLKSTYAAIIINISNKNYLTIISKEKEETVKAFKRLSIKKSLQNELYDNIKEEYEQIISNIKDTVITKMKNYEQEIMKNIIKNNKEDKE